MNNRVRRASAADEPQIQKILENRLQFLQAEERPQFNWNKETLKEELEIAQVWIIETSEEDHKAEIKAFLCFRVVPDAYEITVLTTDPNAARQGHQSNLLTKIKQLAQVEKKQIWLEVHAKNKPALELYKKNRFTISGTRNRYYKDGNDAILMTFNPA